MLRRQEHTCLADTLIVSLSVRMDALCMRSGQLTMTSLEPPGDTVKVECVLSLVQFWRRQVSSDVS